jgi:Phytanoyl-CoA dioxygenase (PhyH)
LRQFIGPDFWVRWDQCVVKGPGAPLFPWHQDNAYSKLRDTHYQLWIGLTEMNEKNGGLWLRPGSHKYRLLPHRRVANHLECKSKPGKAMLIPTEKGDIVLFSSYMLHYTGNNESSADRWAYVVEYLSLDHYDPLITPPYFIVSEGGIPAPRFVESYRGSSNFKNRIKYLPLQARERGKDVVRSLIAQKAHGSGTRGRRYLS